MLSYYEVDTAIDASFSTLSRFFLSAIRSADAVRVARFFPDCVHILANFSDLLQG